MGYAALYANRPLEAAAIFADIAPCDNEVGLVVVGALFQAGDFEGTVDSVRIFRACFPHWKILDKYEVMALAALGRVDEMEQVIQSILTRCRGISLESVAEPVGVMYLASQELSLRGDHLAAQSLAERAMALYRRALDVLRERESAELAVDLEVKLVWLLLDAGHQDEAEDLLRRLVEKAPENLSVVACMGILAARRGDRTEAENAADTLARAEGNLQESVNDTHSRACIAAQLGDLELAVDLLRQNVGFGVPYWYMVRTDPDLAPLRDHPAFQELMRPKG